MEHTALLNVHVLLLCLYKIHILIIYKYRIDIVSKLKSWYRIITILHWLSRSPLTQGCATTRLWSLVHTRTRG